MAVERPDEGAALHERVRAFVAATAHGGAPPESFDALGTAIAVYQANRQPGYARLCRARGVDPSAARTVAELPAVPTDAFRLARIASHPPDDDVAVFRTSGTTAHARGEHAMRTVATYEAAALAWGRFALFPDDPPKLEAIVLAPPPDEAQDSSLGFMMRLFAERFGERATYVVRGGELDFTGLVAACERARAEQRSAIVMGASFAFVHVLDALAGRALPLPERSRAMQTGGFKGKSREVDAVELRAAIARTFGLAEGAVVSEYGMTELSSQAYEGTLRGLFGLPSPATRAGVYVPPPWMRIVPVDGAELRPVPAGEIGVLRFEDLANVDSAVVVQTADRGRLVEGGVELLGRASGAPPRGCSIAIDEILARA